SREQRLFHLALLAQLQGDLIPVSRHLLFLFGDSLGLVPGKSRQRQEKQQDGASPLHREFTFYLYSERFPEVCLRGLLKFWGEIRFLPPISNTDGLIMGQFAKYPQCRRCHAITAIFSSSLPSPPTTSASHRAEVCLMTGPPAACLRSGSADNSWSRLTHSGFSALLFRTEGMVGHGGRGLPSRAERQSLFQETCCSCASRLPRIIP